MEMFSIAGKITPKKAATLFARLDFTDTGCWVWQGSTNVSGYGYATLHHKTVYAHRLFYAWLIGPIPSGNGADIPVLDHLCNVRLCCNPGHMDLVLPRENVMRSDAPPARNARKRLCFRGHELPPRHPVTGRRRCYECVRLRRRLAALKIA